MSNRPMDPFHGNGNLPPPPSRDAVESGGKVHSKRLRPVRFFIVRGGRLTKHHEEREKRGKMIKIYKDDVFLKGSPLYTVYSVVEKEEDDFASILFFFHHFAISMEVTGASNCRKFLLLITGLFMYLRTGIRVGVHRDTVPRYPKFIQRTSGH